jgi:hypothetical protein
MHEYTMGNEDRLGSAVVERLDRLADDEKLHRKLKKAARVAIINNQDRVGVRQRAASAMRRRRQVAGLPAT